MEARDNGTLPLKDPNTGKLNWIDERTEEILTYALCSFGSFGSVAALLGALGKFCLR